MVPPRDECRPSRLDELEELLLRQLLVLQHRPRADGAADAAADGRDEWINDWIDSKKSLSTNTPFDIYSIWINDEFCGWAGIQPDEDCFEIPSHLLLLSLLLEFFLLFLRLISFLHIQSRLILFLFRSPIY